MTDLDAGDDLSAVDFSYSFLKGVNAKSLPSTITVPHQELARMGNMERQYWEIKAKYFNVLIFFKKGKFYELYDYDAVVANKEFGLKMVLDTSNRGKMRLAGVPEQSFNEWARLFVFRGYRVGRVEQLKDNSSGAKAKVVPRELVEIVTPGTITDQLMISDYRELFVLSLVAMPDGSIDGFAVDLSRRVAFWCPCPIGVHSIDVLGSLVNLLYLLHPREIVMSAHPTKGNEGRTSDIAKVVDAEGFKVDFFDFPCNSEEPAKGLLDEYFRYLKGKSADFILNEWSKFSSHLLEDTPPNRVSVSPSILEWEKQNDTGVFIDSQTAENLNLTGDHSLLSFLDCCVSDGGKRLLSSWVRHPSSSSRVINARQDAVRFLIKLNEDPVGTKRLRDQKLDSCGFDSLFCGQSFDLERLISRLSDIQSESTNISYVDPHSQMRKRLEMILFCVDSLERAVKWSEDFYSKCSSLPKGDIPPLLFELLLQIRNGRSVVNVLSNLFDRQAVGTADILLPCACNLPEYSTSKEKLKEIKIHLENQKTQLQREFFSGTTLDFSDYGNDIFLVEVNAKNAPAVPPMGFVERSRSAKSVKYVASALQGSISAYKCESEKLSAVSLMALQHAAKQVCMFSHNFHSIFEALSYFDCLLCFAKIFLAAAAMTFPAVLKNSDSDAKISPCFVAQQVSHPLLNNPIPSDVSLDSTNGCVLLLTGPNMAGKSTLMRTVAVNVILAQMGCGVFAANLTIYPMERIFTRIGARDASHRGQSTLFVELTETANLLRRSNSRSLCLIDELGRGTSTHDGVAIATATLDALLNQLPRPPLILFSTHYHSLAVESKNKSKHLQLGYMDYVIHNAKESVSPITFLYRLASGICNRSFGIEVAQMASLPSHIIESANYLSHRSSSAASLKADIQAIQSFLAFPLSTT